jgi:hypothetical protein
VSRPLQGGFSPRGFRCAAGFRCKAGEGGGGEGRRLRGPADGEARLSRVEWHKGGALARWRATVVDPEFFIHVLEELLERAERGDPAASALLVIPPLLVLVLGGVVVVLVAYETWVKRKKGLR